jgi:hypothetical protein
MYGFDVGVIVSKTERTSSVSLSFQKSDSSAKTNLTSTIPLNALAEKFFSMWVSQYMMAVPEFTAESSLYAKKMLENTVDRSIYLRYERESGAGGPIVLQRRPACHAACNIGATGLMAACCASTGAGCPVCIVGFELLRADCHEKCEG